MQTNPAVEQNTSSLHQFTVSVRLRG